MNTPLEQPVMLSDSDLEGVVGGAASDPTGGISGVTLTPAGLFSVPFTGFAPPDGVSFTVTGENGAGATLA